MILIPCSYVQTSSNFIYHKWWRRFLQWHLRSDSVLSILHTVQNTCWYDIHIWNACLRKWQCHRQAKNTGECASKIMELASCGGDPRAWSHERSEKSPVLDVVSGALRGVVKWRYVPTRAGQLQVVNLWISELNLTFILTEIKPEGPQVGPFNFWFYLIYQGIDEWIEEVEDWVAELVFVDELVGPIESSHVVHYGWWKNPGTYLLP